MSEFIDKITENARRMPRVIGFPESLNPDILRTAERMTEAGLSYPMLFGEKKTIEDTARANGISTEGFRYFAHGSEEERAALSKEYTALFDDFSGKSVIRKSKDALRAALFLLKLGKVDGVAAGKEYTTGDVIFESMSIIGMQEGITSVSSLGIAEIPGFRGGEDGLLGLADCAVCAAPDEHDLAGIAIASADTVRNLLGWEPRVAMLAFSTDQSAEHESLHPIREAVKYVREKRPDIKIDGEFQLDCALLPEAAAKKLKRESAVAGRANVLIFPNLHAGNIGVKMIQIFGKANAYGPVLQGFLAPVCDFSRSAPVEEMLGNVAMLIARCNASQTAGTNGGRVK